MERAKEVGVAVKKTKKWVEELWTTDALDLDRR
jgi:hypothetical protein